MPEHKDLFVTEDERTAIVETMQHNFGACTCMRMANAIMRCPGHAFLSETDGPDDLPRMERMLFVRRTRQQWIDEEWVGTCKSCQRSGVIVDAAQLCTGCLETNPVASFIPDSLPW